MKILINYLSVLLDLKSLMFYFKRSCVMVEIYKSNIYHRFVPVSNVLVESDYAIKFGLDSSHTNRIIKEKEKTNLPIPRELYDNRTGYYIDGTPIVTRLHPLHDKQLVCKKTGKRYVIDTVHYTNYYGKHIMLGMRQEGSKSHKHITWTNISCREPDTVKSIKENSKKYIIEDKTYFEEY
jgi:hypothetical protein